MLKRGTYLLAGLGLGAIHAALLMALAVAFLVWQAAGRIDALVGRVGAEVSARLDASPLQARIEAIATQMQAGGAPAPEVVAALEALRLEMAGLRGDLAEREGLARLMAAALMDEIGQRIAR